MHRGVCKGVICTLYETLYEIRENMVDKRFTFCGITWELITMRIPFSLLWKVERQINPEKMFLFAKIKFHSVPDPKNNENTLKRGKISKKYGVWGSVMPRFFSNFNFSYLLRFSTFYNGQIDIFIIISFHFVTWYVQGGAYAPYQNVQENGKHYLILFTIKRKLFFSP